MGVENIETKILESANAETETIISDAERTAGDLIESAKARNETRAAEAIEAERAALQQQHDEQATSERAANKLKLLAHKSGLLDDVFDKAVEQFIGDRGGDYRARLAAQLKQVADGSGAVVPAEADRAILEDLLKEARGGLALADESLPLRGGFVLRGDKIDLDLSLDTKQDELKEQLLPDLARRAFGAIDHS